MLGKTRHFHDTVMKCSAIEVEWADLNKINDQSEQFLQYFGNYMDDDSTSVWALFGDSLKRYCILISK